MDLMAAGEFAEARERFAASQLDELPSNARMNFTANWALVDLLDDRPLDAFPRAGQAVQLVERFELTHYFAHVEIVPEKEVATYRRLAEAHGWDPATTWMVGNSPRSDINPALAAGLSAVFIPHSATWYREIEEIDHPEEAGRLLIVERFDELTRYF